MVQMVQAKIKSSLKQNDIYRKESVVLAYIYKIFNDINDKLYIGQTLFTVEKRFKEHLRDSAHAPFNKRPLYQAINSFGAKHFFVETLEETDYPDEREKYWIEFYDSQKNGYNIRSGGSSGTSVDVKEIINLYQDVQSTRKVAELTGYSRMTVLTHLRANDISMKKIGVSVAQYDLNNNLIAIFDSFNKAGLSLGKTGNHISDCARGKRKTAYGYKWQLID